MTPVMLNQVSYSMNISTMSIEQYLVHQAKLALKLGDPYASKSWMITARTMFAENFSVQVSAFFIWVQPDPMTQWQRHLSGTWKISVSISSGDIKFVTMVE